MEKSPIPLSMLSFLANVPSNQQLFTDHYVQATQNMFLFLNSLPE